MRVTIKEVAGCSKKIDVQIAMATKACPYQPSQGNNHRQAVDK